MANDTDNNFLVTGASANAVIATDYSTLEGSHFQVTKVAFGNTSEFVRVTDSRGLPVSVIGTPTVVVSSVSSSVGVVGTVGVYGAGLTAVGVTASNFGIRALTAGDPTIGLAPGADFVRIVGFSGGYPVAVTGANLGIRALTAGDPTTGLAPGADFVRIVGFSGAYPVTVSGTSFDIRGLTYTKDSVSVFNTVAVSNGENSPYSASRTDVGFQTRLLRATTSGNPTTNSVALGAALSTVEDTVRVVGLSGAYPVDSMNMGLTNINNRTTRVPFHVDDNGNLYVNLASGTINVTAGISSSSFVLTGVSLAAATSSTQTIQVNGYTGSGAIAIGVTATDLDIRNLDYNTDSVFAATRVLGGTFGDQVGVTGSAWDVMKRFNDSIFFNSVKSFNVVKTDDINTATIQTSVNGIATDIGTVKNAVSGSFDSTLNAMKVSVVSVAQPTGATCGRITTSTAVTRLGDATLKSGVHFKSDLSNTGTTIFVGTDSSGIGYPLYNGDQVFLESDNLNHFWVSASASTSAIVYYIGT